ncbi:MAG TPA: protein-export chaperone SecB [Burkholderiales bacterium]|jgi:preprotein translocase subunit SecB|nr:protein-export chaperone SecB [Burkholderiales bacterium]
MADEQQPSFQIEKLYVKDISLEIPGAPQVFLESQSPQLEIQVRNESAQIAEGLFEVVITVTVTARSGDKTQFLAEAAQAGIFSLRNVPQADLEPLLAVACPTILYPYVRETISDLVTRGGFPPVLLAPVSFEALYAQRLQQQQAAAGPRIELAS